MIRRTQEEHAVAVGTVAPHAFSQPPSERVRRVDSKDALESGVRALRSTAVTAYCGFAFPAKENVGPGEAGRSRVVRGKWLALGTPLVSDPRPREYVPPGVIATGGRGIAVRKKLT